MTERLVIRRAAPADADALGRLGAELIRVHAGFNPRRFLPAGDSTEERYARFLLEQSGEPDAAVFVAVSSDTVIGYVFAALEPESLKELRGPAGFVHDLVVAETSRGQGTGRALMEAALEWFRQQGAPRVLLWTAPQNTNAQRLFKQYGFCETMLEFTREWPVESQ